MITARISLAAIQLDTTIQCRAHIDISVVNDYAERMSEGDKFPPIVLYGTKTECWIADGWHRVMAAQSITFKDIEAELRPGGRIDALKAALTANSVHGLRRTNEDKRKCVEIALREFPKLGDNAIAELCGVNDKTVAAHRPVTSFGNSEADKRTGKDGKKYPARRPQQEPEAPEDSALEDEPASQEPEAEDDEPSRPELSEPPRVAGPPCLGMQYARIAIMKLEEIPENDIERAEAFATVKGWITDHERS